MGKRAWVWKLAFAEMDSREGEVGWKGMDIIVFLWKAIIVVVIIVRRWLKKQLV